MICFVYWAKNVCLTDLILPDAKLIKYNSKNDYPCNKYTVYKVQHSALKYDTIFMSEKRQLSHVLMKFCSLRNHSNKKGLTPAFVKLSP